MRNKEKAKACLTGLMLIKQVPKDKQLMSVRDSDLVPNLCF